jgi:hypothetical protein
MKKKFKCSCGNTTSRTGKDAVASTNRTRAQFNVPVSNPRITAVKVTRKP